MKNTKIIFPEDVVSLIAKIMKKNNLGETKEEIFEKLGKKETTNVSKIAKIIKEAAEAKISVKKLSSNIQKEFNIAEKQADKMAKNFQKDILDLVKYTDIKNENSQKIEKSKSEKNFEESTKPQRSDAYRESF